MTSYIYQSALYEVRRVRHARLAVIPDTFPFIKEADAWRGAGKGDGEAKGGEAKGRDDLSGTERTERKGPHKGEEERQDNSLFSYKGREGIIQEGDEVLRKVLRGHSAV